MISNLVEPLRPYWSLVLAAYFAGFFLATLVAIVYNENRVVRRAYVGGFMSLLIATNLFLPPVAPLTQWHKFSNVPPDEQVMHEVRVVDAGGGEIRYDASATWAVDGISMRHAREEMLAAEPERRRELARYLLERHENTVRTSVIVRRCTASDSHHTGRRTPTSPANSKRTTGSWGSASTGWKS